MILEQTCAQCVLFKKLMPYIGPKLYSLWISINTS